MYRVEFQKMQRRMNSVRRCNVRRNVMRMNDVKRCSVKMQRENKHLLDFQQILLQELEKQQ